jgi:hypothetical protein
MDEPGTIAAVMQEIAFLKQRVTALEQEIGRTLVQRVAEDSDEFRAAAARLNRASRPAEEG